MYHFLITIFTLFISSAAHCFEHELLPNKIHRPVHAEQMLSKEKAALKEAFTPYRHIPLDPLLTHIIPPYDPRQPESNLVTTKSTASGNQRALCLARVAQCYEEIPEADQFAHPLPSEIAQRIIRNAPITVQAYVRNWKAKEYDREPKTLLVTGKSGTGKTALPVAIAQECNIPVFKFTGPLIANEYDQSGEINLIRAFQQAVQHMPCVLAIDEIQVIADSYRFRRSDRNMLPTLAKLLKASEKLPILFVGVTQEITPELQWFVRPDKKVVALEIPSEKQREETLYYFIHKILHMSPQQIDHALNIKSLVNETDGFNYHNLENTVKKAGRTRYSRFLNGASAHETVTMKDFHEAIEKIKDAPYELAGTKRPKPWLKFFF